MDTPSQHDAPRDEPVDAPNNSKPTTNELQEEPRVVVNSQDENNVPTPEEPPTPLYTFDSYASTPAEAQQNKGVDKADDLRLTRQPSRPNYLEEQRDKLRQQAFVERETLQRQGQQDQPRTRIFPPGISVSDKNAFRYLHRLQVTNPDQFTPFREARVPELLELSPEAEDYNAGAREQEDENVRRAEYPAGAPPKQSFWGKFFDMASSLGRDKIERKGVWLCSTCTVYLDTLNPRDRDRANVERMHARLGIWPPFKRVEGINMAVRACARCQQSNFCTLFELFVHE
ncbi:hypothetical protein PWT90_09080 [Aphanocladium album]|nr:hypothetical protein PWT90_09080 [Aphanocladium album]